MGIVLTVWGQRKMNKYTRKAILYLARKHISNKPYPIEWKCPTPMGIDIQRYGKHIHQKFEPEKMS